MSLLLLFGGASAVPAVAATADYLIRVGADDTTVEVLADDSTIRVLADDTETEPA